MTGKPDFIELSKMLIKQSYKVNYRLDTIISEMKIKNLYNRAPENYISSMKIKLKKKTKGVDILLFLAYEGGLTLRVPILDLQGISNSYLT